MLSAIIVLDIDGGIIMVKAIAHAVFGDFKIIIVCCFKLITG